MCDFCTKHGDGKIWYKNARNYGQDLLSDLQRRRYIENFLSSAFSEGFETLGRLETIYRKKGKLPAAVKTAMMNKAKAEHFGQVLPIEEISEVVGQRQDRGAHAVRLPLEHREEGRALLLCGELRTRALVRRHRHGVLRQGIR